MNTGSCSAVYAAKSSTAAVTPPTLTSRPLSARNAGTTSSRRRVTRSAVSSSCGAVVGNTWMIAADASGLACGGDANATPGVSFSCADSCSSAVASAAPPGVSAASSSGPLKPGPKPSESRS